jgi:type I restriction enzyme S subunit
MRWNFIPFEDAIQKVTYTTKIPKKNFLEDGIFPIISQEAEYINGFWNNDEDLFKVDSPVVIFGDHTKIIKYVDFDFVLGADGVKILKPIKSIDSKFFAYFLEAAPVDDLGYARHYRLLKEIAVPVPPVSEQKRIVAILDQAFADIDKVRALTEQNLKNARELFESYLQQVFSQRGEGWKQVRLNEICSFSSGGTPSKKKGEFWGGDIPWISGRDMKYTKLSRSTLSVTKQAISDTSVKVAKSGTILVLVRGMGLAHGAQIGELTVPAAYNQDIRGLHPSNGFNSRFLVFALRVAMNRGENIFSNAAHGTLKINFDVLKTLILNIPSEFQQNEIVYLVDEIILQCRNLEDLYSQKLAHLDELKKSLLQKAFSGELTKESEAAA